MKLYAVVGSSASSGDHAPMFLGIFTTRAEALRVVYDEWLRVDKCVEDVSAVEPGELTRYRAEWNSFEFPVYFADGEDCLDIREYEVAI